MGNVYTKILSGVNIKTLSSSPAPAIQGDLQVDLATGDLNYHNGSVSSHIATAINVLDLTNKTIDSDLNTILNIVDANIKAAAGIVYSKLALTNSIVNADISTSASIAYNKLNLTGDIVNSDISPSASIAYNKLSLGSSIVNSDVSNTAAIAYSKLNLTASIINADVSATAAIAYSKLALSNSIVNADISSSAAIAYSKLNLAGSVLNSDLAGSIAYNKLSLGSSILNSDLAGSISYNKLSLTGSIIDSDVSSSASIAYNKLNLGSSIKNSDLAGSIAYSKLTPLSANSVLGNSTGSTATPSSVSMASAATASAVAIRDANANFQLNNLIENGQSVTTVAGTTNLTVASPYFTQFTGTTTQTCALPDATTLALYQTFYIANRSTGTVTVTDHNGSTVYTMLGKTQAIFNCTSISNSAGTWDVSPSAAGGGSGGTKNYLTTYLNNPGNGDFEQGSTSGWSLFHTTLTGVIPTGSITSGATSVTTFAASQSNVQAGLYSLDTESTSAWTAGHGFITDAFTIDAEDKAKVLNISFAYNCPVNASHINFSGTSSNTFAVYVWDNTNSAWIQPAGVYNIIQSGGSGRCTATFQTPSNSNSYRLAIIAVNASSGAVSMTWDDFFVGPQTTSVGPAMSDWASYTPVLNNITIGNGTVAGEYRRVGDSAEVRITLVAGSTTVFGGSAFAFGIPSGLTIDTTKITGTQSTQTFGVASGFPGSNVYPSSVVYNTTTSVSCWASGGSTEWNNVNPATWGTAAQVGMSFRVPIVGWSSNTSMSADTDTRVVAMRAVTNTGTLAGTFGNVSFTTQNDTHGAFNGTTYTVPVTGYYDITGSLLIGSTGTPSGQAIQIQALKNGSTSVAALQYVYQGNINSVTNYPFLFNEILLNAGDTIVIQALSTATAPTLTNTAGYSYLQISRRSGPAVVAATESVNARYFTSSSSVSGSYATVTFATKDFDSHNQYSGGTYTTPVSGKYQINSSLIIAGSSTVGQVALIGIHKNGTVVSQSGTYAAASLNDVIVNISDVISCVAGDAITIKVLSQATTPTIASSTGSNYFSIARVGN